MLPRASAAVASGERWDDVLDAVLGQLDVTRPDLAFLYASPRFTEHFPDVAQAAWEQSGAMLMAGCSTTGPIANGFEAEDEPAMAMIALELPGAILRPVRMTGALFEDQVSPEAMRERLGIALDEVNGWALLGDRFQYDAETMISQLSHAFPDRPIVGGMATPAARFQRRSWVFLNGSVYGDGGVGIAIGGDYDLLPVVSHGCEPIGETWTITGARGEWIDSISNRPALTLLGETLQILPSDMQLEAEGNLMVGFAANEYQDAFARGDFLIRPISAVDWERGAIAVDAKPRVGQTIQFHLLDAATASLDLTLALSESRDRLQTSTPVAALIHASSARGSIVFGSASHDAGEVERWYPGLPHAGMHSAGEIGPIRGRNALLGLAVGMGIITRRSAAGKHSEISPP
ncbi:MAG: FIST N-terminal domain-containing protein [Thermomicrobiales bacterium]